MALPKLANYNHIDNFWLTYQGDKIRNWRSVFQCFVIFDKIFKTWPKPIQAAYIEQSLELELLIKLHINPSTGEIMILAIIIIPMTAHLVIPSLIGSISSAFA